MTNINRIILQTVAHQHQLSVCGIRLYSRWSHRKPAKVILPFEPTSNTNLKQEKIIDLNPEILNKSLKENINDKPDVSEAAAATSQIVSQKKTEIKSKREEKLKKRKFYLSQQKVFDDNNQIIFEKLKENDGRIR